MVGAAAPRPLYLGQPLKGIWKSNLSKSNFIAAEEEINADGSAQTNLKGPFGYV